MDKQSLYLQELIQEACSYPPTSPQRRKVLNKILQIISKSSYRWKGVGDLYEDALSEAMIFVSEKLCERYEPSRGLFWSWFNTCLRNKYKDKVLADARQRAHIHPSKVDNIESKIDATLLLSTWNSFIQWIEDDPENILSSCYIENNSRANCQSLAYLRIFLGKEWEEIAESVGSPSSTLRSFWTRKCEPLLRKWLDENQNFFGEDNYG